MVKLRRLLPFATLIVSAGSLPAALHTATYASVYVGNFPSCDDEGASSSNCQAEFFDPAKGWYRATASAQASYGFLSVAAELSSDDDIHWTRAWASASLSDTITLLRSDNVAHAQLLWDGDLPCYLDCSVFFSEFDFIVPVSGNAFDIRANLGAGDPLSMTSSVGGSLRLLSIRLLDEELDEVTGAVFYSQSGALYNIEGATQLPEPKSFLSVAVALLLLGATCLSQAAGRRPALHRLQSVWPKRKREQGVAWRFFAVCCRSQL